MNRKKLMIKNGATCANWTWSWSFINEEKKMIIFGAWDSPNSGGVDLILNPDWEFNEKGHKKSAYPQSREHIRLIEEDRYELYTFKIYYSDEKVDSEGIGPATIGDFEKKIIKKSLVSNNGSWYAVDFNNDIALPEEVGQEHDYYEGEQYTVSINSYERSSEAREACIKEHKCICKVCKFDFEKFYGAIGTKYIHVHHIVPLSQIGKEYKVCPKKDLIPVCANCHAMIHRGRKTMSIEALTEHINNAKLQNEF